jgi:hypothetical protein
MIGFNSIFYYNSVYICFGSMISYILVGSFAWLDNGIDIYSVSYLRLDI